MSSYDWAGADARERVARARREDGLIDRGHLRLDLRQRRQIRELERELDIEAMDRAGVDRVHAAEIIEHLRLLAAGDE